VELESPIKICGNLILLIYKAISMDSIMTFLGFLSMAVTLLNQTTFS
jgi:hypothetical protein